MEGQNQQSSQNSSNISSISSIPPPPTYQENMRPQENDWICEFEGYNIYISEKMIECENKKTLDLFRTVLNSKTKMASKEAFVKALKQGFKKENDSFFEYKIVMTEVESTPKKINILLTFFNAVFKDEETVDLVLIERSPLDKVERLSEIELRKSKVAIDEMKTQLEEFKKNSGIVDTREFVQKSEFEKFKSDLNAKIDQTQITSLEKKLKKEYDEKIAKLVADFDVKINKLTSSQQPVTPPA